MGQYEPFTDIAVLALIFAEMKTFILSNKQCRKCALMFTFYVKNRLYAYIGIGSLLAPS